VLPSFSSLTLTNTQQTKKCGNFLKYLRIYCNWIQLYFILCSDDSWKWQLRLGALHITWQSTEMTGKKHPYKFGYEKYVQTMNKEIQCQYYGVHSSTANMHINNATNKALWKNENLPRLCSLLTCFNLNAPIASLNFILHVFTPRRVITQCG
jgi:hypothetical protein